jgi:hypothetical protein
MRYLLMICDDESESVATAEFASWRSEMEARGAVRGGARLQPSSEATTVSVRGRDVVISDGPFAETTDKMGGYHLVECADLDEAIEIASQHPTAKVGRIEIRPVWEG